MVFEHSIPFGAPSQFRMQMQVDAAGTAHLAVLDAFNQPIGNLKDMQAPFAAIRAVALGEAPPVAATGTHSLIEISRTDDPEWLKVHYEDTDAFVERDTTLMIEELAALVEDAQAAVG
jgi:hypothetical protein